MAKRLWRDDDDDDDIDVGVDDDDVDFITLIQIVQMIMKEDTLTHSLTSMRVYYYAYSTVRPVLCMLIRSDPFLSIELIVWVSWRFDWLIDWLTID